MRIILQRVNNAKLTVNNEEISKIGEGYLVLVGYTEGDTVDTCKYLVDRVIGMQKPLYLSLRSHLSVKFH